MSGARVSSRTCGNVLSQGQDALGPVGERGVRAGSPERVLSLKGKMAVGPAGEKESGLPDLSMC